MEKGWINKFKLLFGKPSKINPASRLKAEKAFRIFHRNEHPIEKPLNRYVIWQMALLLVLLFLFILLEQKIPGIYQALFSVFLIVTLINCGAIMEQKNWVVYLEFIRLMLLGLGLVIFSSSPWWAMLLLLAITSIIYHYSRYLQSNYLRLVYTSGKNMSYVAER